MRKLKKILLWFFIFIISIIFAIIIFRNELVLQIIRMEQSARMKKPFTMLELPQINDSIYLALSADFDSNAQNPYQYILDEFTDHDIIFLGENHRIRHDLLFVQKLIPLLYEKGVRNMGFEFALNRDSLLIKDVITNKNFFDQEKANQIIFNLSPFWGFKEYIDLFRAAWEVNKNLPDEAEKFMIYGLMHDFDFSIMKKRSDEFDEEIMLKIRKGVADGDQFMANSIIRDFIKKGKKTLIYCGIHHAFTGYKGHGKRTGVIVQDEIEVKTMTISLHYPWNSLKGSVHRTVYPANGFIDAFIRKHKSRDFAFGINVNNTAFGNLSDTTSAYADEKGLKLSEFCDGYIYLNSFSMAEGVTVQDNFINGSNIEYARTQLPNPELRDGIFKFVGTKVYNQIAGMDADIKYQFRHLY
ncbi:MAG: hypothetical protein KAH26_11740 [Bacteroidales bacterium]|nr:hypothetical protein [Bacteroidales bacterium]